MDEKPVGGVETGWIFDCEQERMGEIEREGISKLSRRSQRGEGI